MGIRTDLELQFGTCKVVTPKSKTFHLTMVVS